MGDNEVSVESVEVALLSEIERSSAMMMKNAYLPLSLNKTEDEPGIPCSQPGNSPQDEKSAGPHALVYMTKLSSRTPLKVIETILVRDPDCTTITGTHDFYTLVLTLSIRLGDPSTTRFLNGSIVVVFPQRIKILTYSPKEKGGVTALIETGGNALSLSPDLDWEVSSANGTKTPPDLQETRFEISVGPVEKITGTYRPTSGYFLNIPTSVLLEYQGMLKNEHEMFWEIYPPMPGQDIDITGKEMKAVFSFIIQAPKKSSPTISAFIEGRVKGNLWGVIPLKGSVIF